MKTCGKCKVEKDVLLFGKDKSRRDGRFSWCKDCVRLHSKTYEFTGDPEVTFKECLGCSKRKAYIEFDEAKKNKTGRTSRCRDCKNLENRTKYALTPEFTGDREETSKTCNTCEATKPLMNFYLDKLSLDGHRTKCIDCYSKEAQERGKKNGYRFRRYGITEEDYLIMIEDQGNKCANPGCRVSFETHKAVIDHCHTTGKVRGAICFGCNSMEGFSYGDPQKLLGMIEYLGYDIKEETEKYARKEQE